MRNKRPIDALFPLTRQAILGAILLEPERWWYLSDLSLHLGRRNPSSLQRELESLVSAEILVRRHDGNRVYFRANRDCPIFPELVSLLGKTRGLAGIVRGSLDKLESRIRLAFIYGSVARNEERAGSDVDLLVVGDLGLAEVAPAVRKAESQLDRAVNATVYSNDEFSEKVKSGHHFVTKVLKSEKLFLIGRQDDLEELADGRSSSTPRHEQAGAG